MAIGEASLQGGSPLGDTPAKGGQDGATCSGRAGCPHMTVSVLAAVPLAQVGLAKSCAKCRGPLGWQTCGVALGMFGETLLTGDSKEARLYVPY